ERGPGDPDALFAAARACEQRLYDPARALALYQRIAREHPDARVAVPALRRLAVLRDELGPDGAHAHEAAALARLVATADQLAPADAIARGDALAAAAWPGAPDAALWVAVRQRRRGAYDDAQARLAAVAARWPGSPQAAEAARDAAGCALDAHQWARADALARELPARDATIRDAIVAAAARGRRFERLYDAAWLALAAALALLLASLAEATWRGGRRWPRARPPVEVLYLAPFAALLAGGAYLTQRTIAPAVARITLVGLGLAWLSGAALDLLRARGRPVRARAVAHVALCAVGAVAIAWISITHDGLLELVLETARSGPE
ncbi:MAG TPA: hypothetical protein VLX92_28130, partial [Kofleriaceae bacterium]|nr:hypothetical protein [Kofleriaceae bacterium]